MTKNNKCNCGSTIPIISCRNLSNTGSCSVRSTMVLMVWFSSWSIPSQDETAELDPATTRGVSALLGSAFAFDDRWFPTFSKVSPGPGLWITLLMFSAIFLWSSLLSNRAWVSTYTKINMKWHCYTSIKRQEYFLSRTKYRNTSAMASV